MARSRQKSPITGMCVTNHESVGKFRRAENRARRRREKQLVHLGNYDSFPHKQEYANMWKDPRDGKQYLSCYNEYYSGVNITYTLEDREKDLRK
jgi:hypothetical protein